MMFRSPFLCRAFTLATFHSVGNVCEVIEVLNIDIKDQEITGAANLRIFAEILSVPVALDMDTWLK